jgi:hypothetical protein
MTATDGAAAGPLNDGEITEAISAAVQKLGANITATGTVTFSAHGRFAVSWIPSNDVAPLIDGQTKAFASITEVDGAGNPILGLADTKIYNVVPTPGRVTIRGEALWDSDIILRISLVVF